jgi:hypothetical protein
MAYDILADRGLADITHISLLISAKTLHRPRYHWPKTTSPEKMMFMLALTSQWKLNKILF